MLYYSNMSNRSYHFAKDVGLGLVTGLFSGLFGVGGGIILVPLLVLFLKAQQKQAQATSLVVVSIAALFGAATYSIAGSVQWTSVPLLVAGGILGTLLGTSLVIRTSDRWLKLAFGALLLLVSLRFFVQAGTAADFSAALDLLSLVGFLLSGVAMGFLSAFLGVGGGVIVIPILVSLFGFEQQLAAGTSLVVMIPITLLGAWRLSRSGFTDWGQGIRIGAIASLAAIAGASIALAADAAALQIGFALLLVFAAAQMIWKALK